MFVLDLEAPQLYGDSIPAFTRNGHHHSSRVGWMLEALVRLPVRSLIIDGEPVACNNAGVPHYYALHFHSRKYGLCAWAFDLLHHMCATFASSRCSSQGQAREANPGRRRQLAALLGKFR
jgi:hypothetical protein